MRRSEIVLEVKDLQKSFTIPGSEESFLILDGVNLKVANGRTVAILGKSGSGKSTLLSLIAGLDSPSSGKIMVRNNDLNSFDEKKLTHFRAKNLSMVFQQFQLINHLSVIDNVILPLYLTDQIDNLSKDKAVKLLTEIDLEERINFFPRDLSGGEKQRVAIARSLMVEPEVILADEPTGNLDVKTGAKVIKQFFQLVKKKNKTLILVTHDLSLAKKCQEIYEIVNGKLVKRK